MASLAELEYRLNNLNASYIATQTKNNETGTRSEINTGNIQTTSEITEQNATDILVTQEGLAETYEEMNNSIIEVEEALAEVYEMIIG